MIMLILELKKELKMTIKYISFDLDDTFWDVMPTIYKAEEITTNWIKENYFGASKLMGTDSIIEIRNKLVNEDSSLKFQISKLRKKIFYETSLLAGYSTEESAEMSKRAFEIFIEARNDVVFFEGALEALERLNKQYSLGVITNGNADLEKIGIAHLFDHCFSSADTNAHKPDPRAFEALIEASGLMPEEICHVGDHPINDVKGSYDCGMKPIWYRNPGVEWPLEELKVPEFENWDNFESVLGNAY